MTMQPKDISMALGIARTCQLDPPSTASTLARALVALADLVKRERDGRAEFDACNISEPRRWSDAAGVLETAERNLDEAIAADHPDTEEQPT